MSDTMRMTPLGTALPAGWRLEPLGPLCSKIGSGATPRGGSAVYEPQGTSFIRSQNVFDHAFSISGLAFITTEAAEKLRSVTVKPRDVLLNITGDGDTIARCCVVPVDVLPARVNQHVAIIRTRSDIVPEFLQRYLSHPVIREYMLNHNSGGSRRALTKSHIESFKIVIPPVPEQYAIASVLGALDDKIRVNNRITHASGSMALLLASEATWSTRTKLSDICDLRKKQVTPSLVQDPIVLHYSLPAFDVGQAPEHTDPTTIMSGKFVIESPSVLLSKLNPDTPRVWRVEPRARLLSLASTEFLVLEPREGITTAELWAIAQQSAFLAGLSARVTGTSKSHQRVRPDEVLASDVVDPRAIDLKVRSQVNSLVERAANARQENSTLASMREALLPKLISGELRIKDAERLVSDAV